MKLLTYVYHYSINSSLCIVTGLPRNAIQFLARAKDFSPLHTVQTDYAHAQSPIQGCSFPAGKVVGTRLRICGTMPPILHTSSNRSV
jgi:hypothetical protein